MWGEKHVSVVLMTYAERYSIRRLARPDRLALEATPDQGGDES